MAKALFLALTLGIVLGACSSNAQSDRKPVAAGQRRIVSLMPSLTEDLFAIGAGPQVVAVDKFSTDVPGAKNLPGVADFSSIDSERIIQLHPDLVVAIPAQSRLLQPLRHAGIDVALLRDDSFNDIFSDIETLGVKSGHEVQARKLASALRERTAQLRRTAHFAHSPSVFVVLDTSPIYTAGRSSYIATLIRFAGGRNAADNLPVAYAPYSAEALLRAQPDAIVTDPSTGLDAALRSEPWRSLRAVQLHHMYVVSPGAILERPGPSYNEGLLWLIQRLKTL